MCSTFWDLCSDVILELCTYFSIDELYLSFYPDVLPHLFKLLTASHMSLHLSLTDDNLLTGILLSLIDTKQISSLRLPSCNVALNTFNAVKTLTLYDVRNMYYVISPSFILPSLQRLILIYSSQFNHESEDVLTQALTARPTLKYLRLQSSNGRLSVPTNLIRGSFLIEQIVINASCPCAIVHFLLSNLPRLRILRIRALMNEQARTARHPLAGLNPIPPLIVNHSSLRILDLIWYQPTVTYLTALLQGLSNLKQCRLSGVMNFQELKGERWHHLLTQTCSNLSKMDVNMLIWTGMEAEEIKNKFDEDSFFKRINFELIPSNNEEELFILLGDFHRLV